jgi:hypothetical protein
MEVVQWEVADPLHSIIRWAHPMVKKAAKFRRTVNSETLRKARELRRLTDEVGIKFAAAAKRVGWSQETARRTLTRLQSTGLMPVRRTGTRRTVP